MGIEKNYRPLLKKALVNRYLTFAIAVASLMIVMAYVGSGRIAIHFTPKAEADIVTASLELPYGSPVARTKKIQEDLIDVAERILASHGGAAHEGIFAEIGTSDPDSHDDPIQVGGGASHAAAIRVYLIPVDERDFTGEQFADEWREEVGAVPGVESLKFEVMEMGPPAGDAISVRLSHRDNDTLEAAASELAEAIKQYPSARDINDGYSEGKTQLDFKLKPEAYSLGLSPSAIGQQVRARFFGAEALRLQRGRDEVKVMVRLPEDERRSRLSIEDLLIKPPVGGELPLREAATVTVGNAYTQIKRTDGHRTLDVTADVIPVSARGPIEKSIINETLPKLMQKYPGLSYDLAGESLSMEESMSSLGKNFVFALIAIFMMLGVVFKSYSQPIIIMAAIPFGIVGAVIGHVLMGFDLTMISMMGIVALSGVVLNDSLVLVDLANLKRRDEGKAAIVAITEAGVRRFRPIILTTFTTFLGLTPMIFETSFQARMLIPMAISLGYGILFSTMIILLLVPALYIIVEDVKGLFGMNEKTEPEKEASAPELQKPKNI